MRCTKEEVFGDGKLKSDGQRTDEFYKWVEESKFTEEVDEEEFKVFPEKPITDANCRIKSDLFENISFGVYLNEWYLENIYKIIKDVDRVVNYEVQDKEVLSTIREQVEKSIDCSCNLFFDYDVLDKMFEYPIYIEFEPSKIKEIWNTKQD